MLSLPCTAYDRILLCLFLVFSTLFWAFLSFQIHPKGLREDHGSVGPEADKGGLRPGGNAPGSILHRPVRGE